MRVKDTPNACGPRKLLAQTCTGCGLFKDASEFYTTTKKGVVYRNGECRDCHKLRVVERRHERGRDNDDPQAKTVDFANRHRQPWTDRECRDLKAMVEAGDSDTQIAIALGRTYHSVRHMRDELRLVKPNKKFKPVKQRWAISFNSQ